MQHRYDEQLADLQTSLQRLEDTVADMTPVVTQSPRLPPLAVRSNSNTRTHRAGSVDSGGVPVEGLRHSSGVVPQTAGAGGSVRGSIRSQRSALSDSAYGLSSDSESEYAARPAAESPPPQSRQLTADAESPSDAPSISVTEPSPLPERAAPLSEGSSPVALSAAIAAAQTQAAPLPTIVLPPSVAADAVAFEKSSWDEEDDGDADLHADGARSLAAGRGIASAGTHDESLVSSLEGSAELDGSALLDSVYGRTARAPAGATAVPESNDADEIDFDESVDLPQ